MTDETTETQTTYRYEDHVPEDQRAHWKQVHVILSMTDHGIVVGWDTCYRCNRRLDGCGCNEGPLEPPYVTKWRSEAPPKKPEKMVEPADADPEKDKKYEALAAIRELGSDDPAEALDPARVRKVRSDKGKPRGPRKAPTAAQITAVKEAAGDLGDAMKENISG